MTRSILGRVALALTLALISVRAQCSDDEALHLNRAIFDTHSIEGPTVYFAAQDVELMRVFCRDSDGCQVTLSCDADLYLDAARASLFMSQATSNVWTTTGSIATHKDNDGTVETVASVSTAGGDVTATLTDRDSSLGDDTDPGFGLLVILQQPYTVHCYVSYQD